MDQILNPFDKVNPFQFDHTNYLKFKQILVRSQPTIKDKKILLEIGRLLESRLREIRLRESRLREIRLR
jgi:hypothetical protein